MMEVMTMKRIALILFALMLFALPAAAEDRAAALAGELLPEYTVVTACGDSDTLLLLMDRPDGCRVFVGGQLSDSGWELTESTPLPAGTEMSLEIPGWYKCAVLGWYDGSAEGTPWIEQYVSFSEDAWQVTLSTMNAGNLIRYLPNWIESDQYGEYMGVFTLPLDITAVDWNGLPRSFPDAMALMDTTGFSNDGWEAPAPYVHAVDAEVAAFVQEHLPQYAAWDGVVEDGSALLLADAADGARYFIGGEYLDGQWRFTFSTPLPADTGMDTFHAGEGAAALYLPLPREKQRLSDGITDLEAYVSLQEDHTWRITGVNTGWEVISFGPHSVSMDVGPVVFGDVRIGLDVTQADWDALPYSWPSAISCLDMTGWRLASAATAPVYAAADEDSALLGRLLNGAPAKQIGSAEGWLQVTTLGGGLTGWVREDDLITMADKLAIPGMSDVYTMDFLYPALYAILEDSDPAVRLYAAPHDEGSIGSLPVPHVAYVQLLGLCAEGCCYQVYHEETGMTGWIPVNDMPAIYRDHAFVANHAPGVVLGGVYYSAVYQTDTKFVALVNEPDQHPLTGGSIRLLAARWVRNRSEAGGFWAVTMSSPLPAGVDAYIDYAAILLEDRIVLCFNHPGLLIEDEEYGESRFAELAYEIALTDPYGAWEIISVTSEDIEDVSIDDFTFDRDILRTDWLALPVQAAAPEAAAAALALHPDHTVAFSTGDRENAFLLLRDSAEQQRLCVLERRDGQWVMAVDSDRAIRPSGVGDMYSNHKYDSLWLEWDGETLSVHYRWSPYHWYDDFTRTPEGNWRFVRRLSRDGLNDITEELTFAAGCVQQTFDRRWESGEAKHVDYPPCPMPWLGTDALTLADFDAAAFPMDVGALEGDALSRVAETMLPGYTCVDGKFASAATFLMDDADGQRFFFGGVYGEDGWTWVKSTPLPEDTFCDSYHAGDGSLVIGFDKPGAQPDEWGDTPYNEYSIELQEDGTFQIVTMFDSEDDYFHIEAAGLYHNMDGLCYGVYTGELDVTKVDWQTIPRNFGEALALMSDAYGVIAETSLPLYGDAQRETLLAEYLYGTPVEVLSREADAAQVRIIGSSVTGWLDARGLRLGREQMTWYTEWDDMYGMGFWLQNYAADAPMIQAPEGAQLFDAPEGRVTWADVSGDWLQLLADLGNGWYHVCRRDSAASGYIRAEGCTLVQDVPLAPALARAAAPEYTLVMGDAQDKTAFLLMDRPDGARVLLCGAFAEGAWHWTESSPLPADASIACTDSGNAVISFRHPRMNGDGEYCCTIHLADDGLWRIYEFQEDSGFNWMYRDGLLMAEDGDDYAGLPGFETDMRHVDWLGGLPVTHEEAVGMLIPAD